VFAILHFNIITADFIITRNGYYGGMGTVLDLLKNISALKVSDYNQALKRW
jgi:hypothetical protein